MKAHTQATKVATQVDTPLRKSGGGIAGTEDIDIR
jgi:hypothetical protein